MKALVLTAESSYARFRCPHTTTSALTFLTLHPIAVRGLAGAIMGIDYKELYDYSKDMKIGIQVLNKVYKDMQSFNLIAQTNNNGAPNFQSRVQFLRDVKYRLFISDKEEKLTEISRVLQSRSYVFTPYLGCSEHIARLNYEGIFDVQAIEAQKADTVVLKEYVDIDECKDIHLYVDRIPIKNNKSREYIEYKNITFAAGSKIPVKDCETYKVGDYNVFFL
jgi:CRISPR-associated protein Cas5h